MTLIKRSSKHPRVLIGLGATLTSVLVVGYGVYAASDKSQRRNMETELRDRPIAVPRLAHPVESGNFAKQWWEGQTFPIKRRPLSSSLCLHMMRLAGDDARVRLDGHKETFSAWEVLTDQALAEELMGQPSLIRTRYGLRFPTTSSSFRSRIGDEAHRDQCLAALAELGVPLSTTFQVEGTPGTIREILDDSIANFTMDQAELAWTLTAYALYLAPVAQWTNRFGDTFSFDDLVREFLGRPLLEESCGATHRFFSLTLLLRVHERARILSSEVEGLVSKKLALAVNAVEESQEDDGSWGLAWNRSLVREPWEKARVPADNPGIRLLVTGHISEWLLYLPPWLSVDADVLERAASWLKAQLADQTPRDVWNQFCPVTHAVCAVDAVIDS